MLHGSASFGALGTTALVLTVDSTRLAEARAAVAEEVEALDAACSRFRDDSELARVNAAAGTPAAASELLLAAVEAALDAARATGGRVDPALGWEIERAGYDRDFAELDPPAGEGDGPPRALRVRARPGRWEEVVVDRRQGTITVPPGVRLDLGASAKALCADRAAARAAAESETGVLVGLGGDVAVAGPPPEGGWPVGLDDDHRAPPRSTMPVVAVHDGGLATSSTVTRRWRHAGRDMHHLLDPRTGEPCRGPWRTVSVAASSCLAANTAATAAIVAGAEAPRWLGRHRLPARLVGSDGEVTTVGAWPATGGNE